MSTTLYYAVGMLFEFLEYAILIDVILSWVFPGGKNKFTEILHIFTEPFLVPGRRIQEKLIPGLMLDFSPIIALLVLSLLKRVLLTFIGMM
ncbi:YGGT family protein [Clostridium acetireducens DSM 10703]|jgi:YggT family protein|uniref:YGGT family protein n=1 Tax=Clostridium acetireducens DSM 10703 TaxID=1121290 RepID=A0A1E8F1P9_9CLOT|nr:YGGT family protein [Clostridium acetireducens DSM 10703]